MKTKLIVRNVLATSFDDYHTSTSIFSHDKIMFQVTSSKFTRELFKELLIAAVASVFMGFGTLFLLLWVGI